MKDDEYRDRDKDPRSDGTSNSGEGPRDESGFNTERFYVSDDDYKKDKFNSYSHYSSYTEDFGKRKDGHGPFFDEEDRTYTDSVSTKDVEKIVDDKLSKKKTPWFRIIIIAFLVAVASFALIYFFAPRLLDDENLWGNTNVVNEVTWTPQDEVNVEMAVNEKAKDSVVGITTVFRAQNGFLPIERYAEGVGSGVVVSNDGYILTNSHVVSDGKAEKINVILADQENYPGELVWYEPEMDLAVVKIEAENLKPIELGDSDELKVGAKAIAIGNPLGLDLQSTLTSGYISGLDRSITMENGLIMDGLIQTDAAINAGNSGGALLDSNGKLIGINTAKASADNIGFAIPINMAKAVVDRINTSGSFKPVVIGFRGVNLDYYEGITGKESEVESGVVVIDVEGGSAAAQAGLKPGDIITQIDGKEIRSMGVLKTMLLAYQPGDTAKLEVVRDSLSETIEVSFSGPGL